MTTNQHGATNQAAKFDLDQPVPLTLLVDRRLPLVRITGLSPEEKAVAQALRPHTPTNS